MRRLRAEAVGAFAAASLALLPGSVLARSGPPVSGAPLPPPGSAMPEGALPAPNLPNAPDLPGLTSGPVIAPPSSASPQAATPPAVPEQVKPDWMPKQSATLDVLFKADGAVSRVTAAVGDRLTEGTLRIRVGACVVRPPDMPPDAAVYLSVRHNASGHMLFRGWLIRSEPGAAVVGDAAVTFRLVGCS
ncbi:MULTISPECIES: DUF2155 domain-containing protein [unclassified Acidiphilium]|uniref:DUF2155 domain-containing protein n=1 Tax=unclassified Acidiphilium TaxID=2617493 RepID=UPI000BC825AF|nr:MULTISPECIES: DUF2155 domain-containing protein [unclassified Acidiphilium]OYV56077.1 MAG: hypothetical protein B7Z76_07670 [Acidiphilium sp. 20-67-58]HQT61217.1 DUF2155 domain-containing protein [Acidiphilium sp.]